MSFLLSSFFAVLVSSMIGLLSVPLHWVFFAFRAELGSCCTWLPPCRGCAEVVSARLNLSQGTIFVGEVCNFLSSVSLQQKIEATDGPVLQLFYLASNEKYILDT